LKKDDYTFRSSPRRSQRRRSAYGPASKPGYGAARQPGYRRAQLASRQQEKRRRTFIFIISAGVLAAVLVFIGAFLLVRGGASNAAPAAAPAESGSGTVLITGHDDAGSLSQLAVLVPESGGGFSLYTIPPRTIADTPGYGFQQIGRVADLGGQELLDQTVANLLQVPIQYHVHLNYPILEIAAEQAGTVNFRTDKALTLGGAGEAINLTAGDNPANSQRSVAILKASVADGLTGPRVQSIFYQGLRDSLALKAEADRRALAQVLYRRLETDLDEEAFTDLLLSATAPGRPFSAWPLPVRLAGSGTAWYLEPVPAEIKALMTGTSRDAAITLEIHNGTDAGGVVEAAAGKLAALRYKTTLQTDPSGVDFDNTQIRAGSEALDAGNRVRDLLGQGTIIKDEYMEKHQIIVIIGKDLTLAALEKR